MGEDSRPLMQEEWNVLVVLDACRYDAFRDRFGTFFSGRLEERLSVGSCTPEWRNRSFPGSYQDTIFVSANPYLNSRVEVAGFRASDHFFRVIDVWATGWDTRFGTVLPSEVTAAALRAATDYPGKRLIVHYIQPHAPYIAGDFFICGFPDPFIEGPLKGVRGYPRSAWKEALAGFLGRIYVGSGLHRNPWQIRETLGLPPASPIDAVRREFGDAGLREAYLANLDLVLGEARDLYSGIASLRPGCRMVITSDHGEFLGEEGYYAHPCSSTDPLLRRIPWLELAGLAPSGDAPKTEQGKRDLRAAIHALKREGVLR